MRLLPWTIATATAVLAIATVALSETGPDLLSDQPPRGFIALLALLGTVDAAIGAAVAARHPRNVVGWLFLLSPFGLFLSTTASAYVTLGVPGTTYVPAVNRLGTVLWSATLPLAFFLFPDGQPPSRGWWRVAWLPVVSAVAQIIPIDAFVAVHLEGLRLALYLAGLATAAIAIIARFRASVGLVRLQLAWIGYAGALVVVAAVVRIASLITTSQELANLAYYGFVAAFWLVPLAAGLAILRYRLYDIGLVIRRTIVYGATTAALAVTFFSLVLLIEAAVRPFTGGNELAIAGSTLATVAVFQPLRARIQELVDRRFYRSRYDAARTLDAFSVRLRDEVNLDAVRVDLVDAVQRTVQPAHASVWLRERPGFSEAATSRWP